MVKIIRQKGHITATHGG